MHPTARPRYRRPRCAPGRLVALLPAAVLLGALLVVALVVVLLEVAAPAAGTGLVVPPVPGVAGPLGRGPLLLVAGGALAAWTATQVASALGDRRRAARRPWAGRTTSRELLVATLTTAGEGRRDDRLDLGALDRVLEDFSATVVAATDATVSVSVAAAPAVLDDAVERLGALGPLHVQRTGALQAPTGRGPRRSPPSAAP